MFSAEQVLKDDDLSYEELASGIIDGGGDGGIDSLYLFVNDVAFDEDIDSVAPGRTTASDCVEDKSVSKCADFDP